MSLKTLWKSYFTIAKIQFDNDFVTLLFNKNEVENLTFKK